MLRYDNKVEVAAMGPLRAYNMKVQPRDSYSEDEATKLQGGGYRCLGIMDKSQVERIEFEKTDKLMRYALNLLERLALHLRRHPALDGQATDDINI